MHAHWNICWINQRGMECPTVDLLNCLSLLPNVAPLPIFMLLWFVCDYNFRWIVATSFIYYNVCNQKLASNLMLLLLLWWFFNFCEHNGELYINKMVFFFIQSYLVTLKMIKILVNGFTPKLPKVVNEGYHNLPLSYMKGFSSFSLYCDFSLNSSFF